MARRRRYIGGTGLLTGCADGDCPAIDMLEEIQGFIEQQMNGASRPSMARPMRPSTRFQVFRETEEEDGKKKKRKRSKYQLEFGRQLKALKRKHPRTPVTRLMKRAHAATRKAMKRKR